MTKWELVEKLPEPWLIKGVALHKGIHYAVFVNPETGQDELWQSSTPLPKHPLPPPPG